MKTLLFTFILLSTASFAQTRSIVPYADGQGSVGRTNKQWQAGYFENVIVNGTNLNTRISSNQVFTFNALTGSVELVAGDGVQIVTNGNQLTVRLVENPSTSIGTNRVYFRYSGYTNYWTVPNNVTQLAVWAWGAAGGSRQGASGPAGGFSYGIFNVAQTSILTICVGQVGIENIVSTTNTTNATERAFPNGGRSIVKAKTVVPRRGSSGGGSSHIFLGTNILIVAGGGGGGGHNTGSEGGLGGGITGTSASGVNILYGGYSGSQVTNGFDPSLSIPSTNLAFITVSASFMQGGDSALALDSTGDLYGAGGGGGYWGGSGSTQPPGNSTTVQTGGGGGSGFVSQSALSGLTIRGNSSTPSGQELPEYISGVGAGGGSAGNGLIVIGY